MNQSTTLAVVGGDVRQAYLAELLHEAGHTVRTFALERRPAAGCTAVSDLQACLDDARAVILHSTPSAMYSMPFPPEH